MKTSQDIMKFCKQRQKELVKHIEHIETLPSSSTDYGKEIHQMYVGKLIAYQEVIEEIGLRGE